MCGITWNILPHPIILSLSGLYKSFLKLYNVQALLYGQLRKPDVILTKTELSNHGSGVLSIKYDEREYLDKASSPRNPGQTYFDVGLTEESNHLTNGFDATCILLKDKIKELLVGHFLQKKPCGRLLL
jgi:hypothetical protein